MVEQNGVVLETSPRREMGESSGGTRPFLNGVGEPVVHLEGEDAAITNLRTQKGPIENQDKDYFKDRTMHLENE